MTGIDERELLARLETRLRRLEAMRWVSLGIEAALLGAVIWWLL